ncbi:GNAT family N-acetyltransferase [Alteromonas aestuariivivens]|uniref:Protein ElaA n=1 Tax=Alteromonas aestuariivivens TaxID=1938339 RepID=A0A3D8M6T1_9ALTE|nr:GNAT family N-acetyltransferase [Alteromonas aestuariivivens]RDV25428.1 GNAT family N-acetyltransferase [Alteromonas aestuariivivens]
MISWQLLQFSELSTEQLYTIMQLRVNVFVVEQNCPYPELDDKDSKTGVYHLLGYQNNELVAYARLLAPGISYPSVSIGRVATRQSSRGTGLGHELIRQALHHCDSIWPGQSIEIGAQAYLEDFYAQYGFVRRSENYLEDGIPHLDMLLGK